MGLISNGTTLLDAGAIDSGISTGAMVLLSTQTASSSSTISFTSGINSTYKEYIFKFIDIHAQTDKLNFNFKEILEVILIIIKLLHHLILELIIMKEMTNLA